NASKIVDLERILVLDPLSLSLEPVVIDLQRLSFAVLIEGDVELADAIKWRTDSAGDEVLQIVVGHINKLRRQGYLSRLETVVRRREVYILNLGRKNVQLARDVERPRRV